FSNFIEHPILLAGGDPEKGEERVNAQKAIWLRNKSEVTEEEYAEFYRQISGDTEAPAKTVHYSVEGQQDFRVLLFIPAHKPLAYEWEEPKPGLKLYAQRVLIMDPCEDLLPTYMRFVKGVLDSADVP